MYSRVRSKSGVRLPNFARSLQQRTLIEMTDFALFPSPGGRGSKVRDLVQRASSCAIQDSGSQRAMFSRAELQNSWTPCPRPKHLTKPLADYAASKLPRSRSSGVICEPNACEM